MPVLSSWALKLDGLFVHPVLVDLKVDGHICKRVGQSGLQVGVVRGSRQALWLGAVKGENVQDIQTRFSGLGHFGKKAPIERGAAAEARRLRDVLLRVLVPNPLPLCMRSLEPFDRIFCRNALAEKCCGRFLGKRIFNV